MSIYKQCHPGWERILVDLGYYCHNQPEFVLPFKKPPGGSLTVVQQAYNDLQGFARAVVEHVFGAAKAWRILSATWRGRLMSDDAFSYLHDIFGCVIGLVTLMRRDTPGRLMDGATTSRMVAMLSRRSNARRSGMNPFSPDEPAMGPVQEEKNEADGDSSDEEKEASNIGDAIEEKLQVLMEEAEAAINSADSDEVDPEYVPPGELIPEPLPVESRSEQRLTRLRRQVASAKARGSEFVSWEEVTDSELALLSSDHEAPPDRRRRRRANKQASSSSSSSSSSASDSSSSSQSSDSDE